MQGAQAQVAKKVKHWILERTVIQAIITNLDTNRMTLKAAKLYFSAYGVDVKGRTKEQFIKNLCQMGNE